MKYNGGPAFARTLSKEERDAHAMKGYGPAPFAQDGLSVRDYFAAKAMQSLVQLYWANGWQISKYAEKAYEMADAMIAERDKR